MPQHKRFIVSAVIPVYNGEKFIIQTLHSLLSQTRKFDEIIVVDDGSTDNTVSLVQSLAKHGIQLIRSGHVERVAARNIGWRAAKGNIIAFIDSDLILVKDWLKEVLRGFDQGHVAVVDRRAVYQPKTFIAKMNDHFFDIRYADNYKPFTLWVIQKTILKQIGGYDPGVVGIEDADLADRLIARGYTIPGR
jgi:glycosyltransferase involved in cell wall biosynthesis